MRRLAAGLAQTFRYWMQTEVHVYAFSVAANVLLSFFPFLIVMLSFSRRVFGEQTAVEAIDLALRDFFPDALGQFLHRNLPQTGSVAAVSIVLLLFTANGIFEPLEVALNRIWGIPRNRSFFRNQIVSLGLIFSCGALGLLSLMLTALSQQSLRAGLAPGSSGFGALVGGSRAVASMLFFKLAAVPLAVLVLFLIYRYLPNGRTPLNRVLPAAIFVGLFMELLKYVNALVWPSLQRKLANEYGVFQYSVTLIFLGFLASMLVLAGAEWAARGHRLDRIPDEGGHA
jgi:YihY family inner membrane protein